MSRLPLVDRALDTLRATGTYGMAVRAGLVVACACSMVGAEVAGGTSNPLLAVCAALLALGTVARPDSHFGLALVAVLALQWYAADVSVLAWSLLPALAILAVHVLAAHAAIVPPRAETRRGVTSRWLRHTGAAALGTLTVWLLTISFNLVHAAGAVLLTSVGALLISVVTVGFTMCSTSDET